MLEQEVSINAQCKSDVPFVAEVLVGAQLHVDSDEFTTEFSVMSPVEDITNGTVLMYVFISV